GPLQVARGEEGGGPRFRRPEPGQQLTHQPAPALVEVESPAGAVGGRDGAVDPLVAVVAGDLLDDVDLPVAVRSPARDADELGAGFGVDPVEPERAEVGSDLAVV